MRQPLSPVEVFKKRRIDLLKKLNDQECIILFSQPHYYRQIDITFPYRQNSFFYYLTGFEESDSCLLLSNKKPSEVLFVKNKNKMEELWDGTRFGLQLAQSVFSMDECFSIATFGNKILSFLEGITDIYQIRGINPEKDRLLEKTLVSHKTTHVNLNTEYNFLDARRFITPMRMIKDNHEIKKLKKACEISKTAHIEVMKAAQPGVNERLLYATFIYSIMKQNCERESYSGIFATGENALILHYIDNNQPCKEGDLVLVDAGAEWEYYASDITRTFPVSGKYSPAQKILYEGLLHIQKKLIESIRPQLTFKEIQNNCCEMIYNFFVEEKILSKKESPSNIKQFFPHNFGHLLGLDVHDVGQLKKGEKSFTLKEGMVLTIEPGIYISKDSKSVPEKFRGIGIRIEDNILVTNSGYENLSECIPKEVHEIEDIMKRS